MLQYFFTTTKKHSTGLRFYKIIMASSHKQFKLKNKLYNQMLSSRLVHFPYHEIFLNLNLFFPNRPD
jgi:hypothetical protein